jgi:hypothetical protein
MNLKSSLLSILVILLFLTNCKNRVNSEIATIAKTDAEINIIKQRQDSIIDEHLKNGAWKHSYYSPEWSSEIDKGLAKDSTIAYLWQQKAMPLFKQGKYEIVMELIIPQIALARL